MICPRCSTVGVKVIYYGLPHRLCDNDECVCLWGPFDWLTTKLPFNGFMLQYQGSYWSALWTWLTEGQS